MEVECSEEQQKCLMKQLEKMEKDKSREQKVPHLSEATKVALGLVGY